MILKNARIVLEDGVQEGSLCIENGKIAWISGCNDGDGLDLGGMYLAPGFVDQHNHGCPECWFEHEPARAARWHLWEGTTSLLCSLSRHVKKYYSYEQAYENIRAAMGPDSPIRGVHMEGPYLDQDFGVCGKNEYPIIREEYRRWMDLGKGLIKQWTFDPTREGAEEFAKDVQKQGIPLSVCYSRASPELLAQYLDFGLRIGDHIFDATSAPDQKCRGVREPGSDEFVLVEDKMIAELTVDSLQMHVRPYNLKLAYKCKGPDGIALITDCCAGGDPMGGDVNIVDGALYGSQLTLSKAVRNTREQLGLGICELIRMASTTPAKTIGLYGERGSIHPGKVADLVVLDDELHVKGVILGGKIIRKEF